MSISLIPSDVCALVFVLTMGVFEVSNLNLLPADGNRGRAPAARQVARPAGRGRIRAPGRGRPRSAHGARAAARVPPAGLVQLEAAARRARGPRDSQGEGEATATATDFPPSPCLSHNYFRTLFTLML